MRQKHKIAIVGYGRIGQCLSSKLLEQGHTIVVYDSNMDPDTIQTIMKKQLAFTFPQPVFCFPFHVFKCKYVSIKVEKKTVLPKFNMVGNLNCSPKAATL